MFVMNMEMQSMNSKGVRRLREICLQSMISQHAAKSVRTYVTGFSGV